MRVQPTRFVKVLAVALAVTAAGSASVASAACSRSKSHSTYYRAPVTHVVKKTVVTTTPAIVEAVVVPARPKLTVGKTITASAKFLGNEPGHVFVQLGNASLECTVVAWSSDSVTFVLPRLGLHGATPAKVELLRPTGDLAKSFGVSLVPPAALVEAAEITEVAVAAGSVVADEAVSIVTE
jgi:hypothetical protein